MASFCSSARIGGFTETGSFTSLSFAAQTRNSEISLLGAQAYTDWGIWHPFAQLVWDHEFDPLNRTVTASLTTIAAPSFSLPAVVVGRDWATATIGTLLPSELRREGCLDESHAFPRPTIVDC